MRGNRSGGRVEVLLGAGTFVLSLGMLLVRFLVPRPVGVTDNGDGWRLLCEVGAYDMGQPTTDEFVRFSYQAGPPDCVGDSYVASQIWFAKVAQWLDGLFGGTAALNVVTVGVVCCVVAAAGVTVVVLGLPLAFRYRVLAGALVLLVIADSAFFGYFASVLTEGPAFLGVLLAAGGLLLMCRPGGWRYAGAVVTVLGGVLGGNAKAQAVLIVPALVVAVLLARPAGVRGAARWVPALAVVGALAAGALLSGGGSAGENTKLINVYNTVFNSIVSNVDGKHDAAADLAALGLPPDYARYAGTYAWWPNAAPNDDPDFTDHADEFTRANLVDYYVSHPGRTVEILDRAATDLLTARPDYQGSFAVDAGEPPGTKEFRVPVLSGIAMLLAPLGLLALVPLWLLSAAGGVVAVRRGRRGVGVVVLFLLTSALGQFLVAGLAEGIENVKHQVIALFCTLLAAVFGAIGVLPGNRETDLETAELAVVDCAPYEASHDVARSPAGRARRVRHAHRDPQRPATDHRAPERDRRGRSARTPAEH